MTTIWKASLLCENTFTCVSWIGCTLVSHFFFFLVFGTFAEGLDIHVLLGMKEKRKEWNKEGKYSHPWICLWHHPFRCTRPCIFCLLWVESVEINPMLFLLLASPETLWFECLSKRHRIHQLDSKKCYPILSPTQQMLRFCKSNSFIMLIPLFCHTHHFHLTRVEKSSDGFGSLNKWCLTFNEMGNMKNKFQWRVASDNHNKTALWTNRRSQYNCGSMLWF